MPCSSPSRPRWRRPPQRNRKGIVDKITQKYGQRFRKNVQRISREALKGLCPRCSDNRAERKTTGDLPRRLALVENLDEVADDFLPEWRRMVLD